MHEIRYGTYEENVDKSKVQKYWDKEAERYSDSGSPLYRSINWLNHICDSYDEAMEYIQSHDNGWYDQFAVRYKEPNKPLTSKILTSLKERREKEYNKIAPYTSAHSVKNLKAKYITCSCCGSKLKKEMLQSEHCPLCRIDLRSKTTIETIKKYKDNVRAIDEKIKTEEKILASKCTSNIKWLVKVEYHT